MKPYAACTTAVLALLLAGASTAQAQREYRGQSLDLLRLLNDKPWIGLGPHNRWDRAPHIDAELGNMGYEPRIPHHMRFSEERSLGNVGYGPGTPHHMRDNEEMNYIDEDIRRGSQKRSAVATALNSSRRRRQPPPAIGKAVTPYVGVGVLTDMNDFFDSLRGKLKTFVSLTPEDRTTMYQEPPSVVQAPEINVGGGGGGSGTRKLYALRPLRPTGNIRSYNRRSLVEADGGYPGANHHDPGLLWTGLGR